MSFSQAPTALGSATTDANGTASLAYNGTSLDVGDYDVQGSFAGDGDMSAASDTDLFSVAQGNASITTAGNLSATAGGTLVVRATVTPGVAGEQVTFSIPDLSVSLGPVFTDATGAAQVTWNVDQIATTRSYSAAKGLSDNLSAATSADAVITINPAAASTGTSLVDAPSILDPFFTPSVPVTVTLKDMFGNPLTTSGGTVTLDHVPNDVGTLTAVTDNGDGTYTAGFSATTAEINNSVTIRGYIDGVQIEDTAEVGIFTVSDPPPPGSEPARVPVQDRPRPSTGGARRRGIRRR
jgi:adhesin/invasin